MAVANFLKWEEFVRWFVSQFRRLEPGLMVIALLLLVSSAGLSAQESLRQGLNRSQDSLRFSSVSFDRVLNTFIWNGSVNYDREFNGIDVKLRQLLRSRLIRTDPLSIQDEYNDTLSAGLRMSDRWTARLLQISSVVSDNRAIDLTKLAQHQFLLGVRVNPISRVTLGAFAGYEIDAQQAELDQGMTYQADAEADAIQLEEFRGSLRGQWSQSLLTRRRPSSANLDLSLVREFGADTRNTILVSYDRLRREFYTAADPDVQRVYGTLSNIFRRDASTLEVSDELGYRASERMQITFRGGILNRTIDRGLNYKVLTGTSNPLLDTRIQEMQLFGEMGTAYEPLYWLTMNLNLSYREREERHEVTEQAGVPLPVFERQQESERRLENIARRTSISSRIWAQVAESDQLNFAGSASILRYDTPDTTNTDERDELLLTVGIEEIHRFSNSLVLSVAADVTLSHLVYLKSVQSANNNWNRIVRFSPTVTWISGTSFRTVNQAEVLGNYTVYDFEDQGALTKSFSFRQASWLDSTAFSMTQRTSLSFVGEVRVYERGILRWQDFKERPQNYFVERTFWPQVIYKVIPEIRLSVGFRFFSQNRYRYDGSVRFLEQELSTSGPTVALEWVGTGSQRLVLEGWRETQKQDGQVTRTIPNLSLKVNFSL